MSKTNLGQFLVTQNGEFIKKITCIDKELIDYHDGFTDGNGRGDGGKVNGNGRRSRHLYYDFCDMISVI